MPDLTTIMGTLTDASGEAKGGARVTIRKVVKGGVLISTKPVDFYSEADGSISFEVHRDSVAYIDAPVVGLNTRPGTGVALTIPNTPAASLEDLVPATSTALPGVSQAVFNAFRATLSGARTVTESAALETDEFAVVADSETDIILALPPAADRELPYYVKNINTGLVTLDPDGIETVNREASLVIASGDAYIVVPATGGWETW